MSGEDEADSYTVEEDFAFLGRTFEEYVAMFGLDPPALAGRRVLDCPGGPSAFTAVASAIGATATAVDPAYGPPASALTDRCRRTVDRTVEQLREKRDQFVWEFYGDVETRGQYLRAGAERFLADYRRHPARYAAASLPDLPFREDAFDLVLSGNLCFLYDDRLDAAFHREAVLELCRIARDEVRLFTLASLDGTRSDLVEPVREACAAVGHRTRLVEVPYEFQPGATTALVCEPDAGGPNASSARFDEQR